MDKLALCCALLVGIPAISAYAAHGGEYNYKQSCLELCETALYFAYNHTGYHKLGFIGYGSLGIPYGVRGYNEIGNEEPSAVQDSVGLAAQDSVGQQTPPQPGDAAILEVDPNTDRDRPSLFTDRDKPSLLQLLVNAFSEGDDRVLVETVVSLLEGGAGRGTNRVELATNKDVIAKEKETVGEETIEDDGSSTKKEDVVREREYFGKEQVLQRQEQRSLFYIPPPGSSDAVVTLLRMTLLLLRDVFDLETGISCDYLSRKECAGLVLIETIEKLIRERGLTT